MTTAVGADVVLLTLGFMLVWRARGRTWLTVYGLFAQAEIIIGYLLRASIGARQLDLSGVPFALALFCTDARLAIHRETGCVSGVVADGYHRLGARHAGLRGGGIRSSRGTA